MYAKTALWLDGAIAMTSDLIPYKYAKQLKILKRVKVNFPMSTQRLC